MEIDKFLAMPYSEVQLRAKELGYSKAVATRAYNLVRLANASGMPRVKGIGSKTLEFLNAL